MNNIEKIIIEKLHGDFTYEISLSNNKLVVVAENGAGKTTIVNIIYCLLSRQWEKLDMYNFFSITVFFSSAPTVQIFKAEIIDYTKIRRLRSSSYKRNVSARYRDLYDIILARYGTGNLIRNELELEHLAHDFGYPINLVREIAFEISRGMITPNIKNEFREKEKALREAIDAQILYLPTYRRIEQDLKTIFPQLEENVDAFRKRASIREEQSNIYVELVEFGMEDVEKKINSFTVNLYNNFNNDLLSNITGSYLRDIINKKYMSYELDEFRNIKIEVLDIVLRRIKDDILDVTEKGKLRVFVEELGTKDLISNEDRVIAHFIYRLIEIYTEQRKREKDIEDFVEVCNAYINNKHFYYDPNVYELNITLKRNNKPITLKDLSSGEKQIVSLFSHLYLSKEKKFFVIIDEPELSLSVIWQLKFLPDIIKAKYCAGLIAVTHSPYIFDNELDPYTKGLEEFIQAN